MISRNDRRHTRRQGTVVARSAARCLAVALPAAWFALLGCKPEGNTFAPPPPAAVTVAHPVQRSVTQYIESTGTTEAYESVDLRARVPGFLDQIKFKPGAAVHKGELLFVIDKRTYQAAVDRAQAQVLSDEAAHKAAESDAQIAEELASKRAGSEIDKITKIGRRDSAAAGVAAAQAALETAKLDLEFCDVRAPIDGRISKNLIDVGNLVGAAGQPTVLATMVSSKPLYVTLDSSERDFFTVRKERMNRSPGAAPGELSPGMQRPVKLATADQDEFSIDGHIDYVDPTLNAQTGTIHVRCRFENEREMLLPGMFVRVRVLLESTPAILAPDIALLSDQSGRYALVVNDKNMVEIRRVKIGPLDGTMRVVAEGLALSDRIVINGLQRARPGATVNPTIAEVEPAKPTTTASTIAPSAAAAAR